MWDSTGVIRSTYLCGLWRKSMFLANTHHCHVVQHATIHPPLIKLGLILRQTNVIQPSWEEEEITKCHEKEDNLTVKYNLVKLSNSGKKNNIKSVSFNQQRIVKVDLYLALAAYTHLLPSCSPTFPYYPPPLSRGPAEPAAASFCAAGVWCPAPKHAQKDKWGLHITFPGCTQKYLNDSVSIVVLFLGVSLTLSRSCCEACSSVCPEEIHTRAMFT